MPLPGDYYWTSVAFLSGFEAATPTDESPTPQTVTTSGGPANATDIFKFGAKSLFRNNTTGKVTVPKNIKMPAGVSPWTIEGWYRWTSPTFSRMYLMGQLDVSGSVGQWAFAHDGSYYGSGNGGLYLLIDAGADGYLGGLPEEYRAEGPFTPAPGIWYHLAADFDGAVYRTYVDGQCIRSDTEGVNTMGVAATAVSIGSVLNSGNGYQGFIGNIDEVRITGSIARYATDGSFPVPTAAFPRTLELNREVIETIQLESIFDLPSQMPVSITDTFQISPFVTTGFLKDLSETLQLLDEVLGLHGTNVEITDGLIISDSIATYWALRIRETLGIIDTLGVGWKLSDTLTENIRLSDALTHALGYAITETVGFQDTVTLLTGVAILEQLGIAPSVAVSAIYSIGLTQGLKVTDVVGLFLGADVVDGLGIHDALDGAGRLYASLADTVNIVEAAIVPVMLLRADVSEHLAISSTELLQMLYQPEIVERLGIGVGLLFPGEGFTAWAMNTRTGAVTEYGNYQFNSFAKMGNRHVAASHDGLYELLGDTDDGGAPIIAKLRSGLAQFAGTHLHRFKAIYIAMRGEGDFVLRLITAEDVIYHYKVQVRNMRSTKVHVGKGLRARYWAFELESIGQDFDLESVEFVPLPFQRRV